MSSRVTNVNVQSQPFHLQSCLDPRFSVEMVQSLIKDMCKRLSKSQQCIVFIGILASLNFWPEKSFLHKYMCVQICIKATADPYLIMVRVLHDF
jgi:hypothetical protein